MRGQRSSCVYGETGCACLLFIKSQLLLVHHRPVRITTCLEWLFLTCKLMLRQLIGATHTAMLHHVLLFTLFAGHIDILDVFRKPSDLPPHLDDILAAKPAAVWLQSGITNPDFEEALAKAGIKVVSDRCLMVDHRASASRM